MDKSNEPLKVNDVSMCQSFSGTCPICENEATFEANNSWFRDHLLCQVCGSIPRERALAEVLAQNYPNYRSLKIHESSPCMRGLSLKLSSLEGYSSSYYFPNIPRGKKDKVTGFRCEDLENMTFPDNSFDLFITQDVFEHLFDPEKAFEEVARVLKPGGAHIFSVPLINKGKRSEKWAERSSDGNIIYHGEPEYHGNPVDPKGSLVCMHWGYDITDTIVKSAGTPSTIVYIDDITKGIRAEYIEIIVSKKYPHAFGDHSTTILNSMSFSFFKRIFAELIGRGRNLYR